VLGHAQSVPTNRFEHLVLVSARSRLRTAIRAHSGGLAEVICQQHPGLGPSNDVRDRTYSTQGRLDARDAQVSVVDHVLVKVARLERSQEARWQCSRALNMNT
jgi:hypothetical protein